MTTPSETGELRKTLVEARGQLAKLRDQRASGSLKDGSLLRKRRREIARILTRLWGREARPER